MRIITIYHFINKSLILVKENRDGDKVVSRGTPGREKMSMYIYIKNCAIFK